MFSLKVLPKLKLQNLDKTSAIVVPRKSGYKMIGLGPDRKLARPGRQPAEKRASRGRRGWWTLIGSGSNKK